MVANAGDIQAAFKALGLGADFNKLQGNGTPIDLKSLMASDPSPKGTSGIANAIAALNAIGSNYKDPLDGFTAPTPQVQANPYRLAGSTPIDWSGVGADLGKSAPKASNGNGIDWWGLLSGTLGQVGGAVTNSVYNGIDDLKKEWSSNDPWYKKLASTFEEPKNAIVNSLESGAVNGAKEQWKDWTDGKLSWGDIPGVGFLHGTDQGWKRGSDIAGELGATNPWVKGIGGFGLDVALDPLTYLTGGLSTASKLGKVAELSKIAEYGSQLGIDTSKIKNADEFLNEARNVLTEKYSQYPNLVDKIVNKKLGDITNDIQGAHAGAFNANINKWGFSVPFSNKLTAAVGNVPKWSPVYRTEATLGNDFQHIAQNLINDTVKNNGQHAQQLTNAVLEKYGIHSLGDLTKSQFEDLSGKLGDFKNRTIRDLPDSKVTEQMVTKSMPNEIFNRITKEPRPVENVSYTKTSVDDILKSLDPRVANKVEPLLRGLGDVNDIRKLAPEAVNMFGDFAKKLMRTAKGKTLTDVQNTFSHAAEYLKNVSHTGEITKAPNIVYQELERMVEHFNGNAERKALENSKDFYKNVSNFKNSKVTGLNNAKTSFEHFLDKHSPFNARTLKTGDKFVNSMADHIADASSQRVGNTAKYGAAMEQIQKFIKKNGMNDKDMMDTIYHLEGKTPKSYGKDWTPSTKVQQLASIIKPVLDKLGSEEKSSGVLEKLRENYFPHVSNLSDDELKAMKEFQDRHPELKGQNEQSKFNNERQSFPTMADRQNYLDELSKNMQNTTDPTELENLQNQFSKTRDMFDTNIPSALTSRIREGVRAESMKAMHGELKKFGMLETNPKNLPRSGMVKLDASQVKKLGLGEGQHYMHKDVLKGMEKVDEIFTSAGMNKMVRQMNAVTDIFRSGVTTFKMSHYRNNIIGNAINNMAAGVKPSEYKAAGKLLKAMKNGKLTDSQMKIVESAYKHNVINGGFISDLTAHGGLHFDDPTKLEKFAKLIADNPASKKIRSNMEKIDDVFRLGNFINGLNKYGGNEAKAAGQVREYLFNYNEMTNADRKMRMVMPFWNWTKRNIPLQMKNLMEHPAIALNFERSKAQVNKGQKGEDWQKDSGYKIPGLNYYTSVSSPTDDLKSFAHPIQFLSGMNPVLKMAIEGMTNKQLYTGKPIVYGGKKDNASKDILNYVAKNFGVTGSVNDFIQSILGTNNKTPIETGINYVNPISKVNPKSGVN